MKLERGCRVRVKGPFGGIGTITVPAIEKVDYSRHHVEFDDALGFEWPVAQSDLVAL